jgi:hypothetical protein
LDREVEKHRSAVAHRVNADPGEDAHRSDYRCELNMSADPDPTRRSRGLRL